MAGRARRGADAGGARITRALRDVFDRARNIKLLAMDVDGVLTDGTIWMDDEGRVSKRFDIRDGHGLVFLPRHGVELAILSGRNDEVTTRRAEDLRIKHVVQGLRKKLPAARELAASLKIDLSEMAYVGDDINDVPVIEAVGLGCAPANACPEARRAARFVAPHDGGRGALRDVAELLLKARGAWVKVLDEMR